MNELHEGDGFEGTNFVRNRPRPLSGAGIERGALIYFV